MYQIVASSSALGTFYIAEIQQNTVQTVNGMIKAYTAINAQCVAPVLLSPDDLYVSPAYFATLPEVLRELQRGRCGFTDDNDVAYMQVDLTALLIEFSWTSINEYDTASEYSDDLDEYEDAMLRGSYMKREFVIGMILMGLWAALLFGAIAIFIMYV